MYETVALQHYMHVGQDWVRHRAGLTAFLAAALMAMVLAGIALPVARVGPSPLVPSSGLTSGPLSVLEGSPAFATRELPAEWKWQVDEVHFEQMYREADVETRELDWIGDPWNR